ncbi:phenylacetic acid degradation protein paaI [alpha proteobacterium U9-1i]|nr:phenylacetic acid degradation protein paaI [alpha proteobacterium U9-1i]
MSNTPYPFAAPEEALAAFKARDLSGFFRTLAAEPTHWWKGEAELLIPLKPELLQHHGYAHGAIVGAAADNACAWAAASAVGDVVTSSYTIQFLAPAKGDRLRARGIVLKAGKRQVSCEAKVWCSHAGGEETLVAVALALISPVTKP